jgi:DNA repair exonuclease SbcCD ATPase subunit
MEQMMTGLVFRRCGATRPFALVAAALALCAVLAMPSHPAQAQRPQPSPSDAITPVEEYARQVEQLKKNYPDLAKRIEESAKTIDEVTDVDKARKEIEELRTLVANMLGAVSDNGTVSQLGAKALSHARAKLRQLDQEARFKPEERQFLVDLWRKLIAETEHATDDLDNARKEFAELLRTLQTREDFIDELMQVRRAAEAIRVIRELTREIRDASDKLKSLINGIKPPGV